jgi:hypothetical protein
MLADRLDTQAAELGRRLARNEASAKGLITASASTAPDRAHKKQLTVATITGSTPGIVGALLAEPRTGATPKRITSSIL